MIWIGLDNKDKFDVRTGCISIFSLSHKYDELHSIQNSCWIFPFLWRLICISAYRRYVLLLSYYVMHLLHAVTCLINKNDMLLTLIHYTADQMIFPGNYNSFVR
jgi:hypothetical protein